MPAAPTAPTPAAPPRTRERGFALVELIIALAIIGILLAVFAPRMLGAKTATYAKETKAAGATYAQVISQYQADNHNRHPPLTAANVKKGPMNLLNKPYLSEIPDAVASGKVGVDVGVNCGGAGVTGAGSQYGQVSICFNQAPRYGVRVATRSDTSVNAWTVCWYGSSAATPRC